MTTEKEPTIIEMSDTGRKNAVSKYDPLWDYVKNSGSRTLKLTFEEIGTIAGVPLDHSFLKYKKELAAYGYQVGKISMKEQTILFQQLDPQEEPT